MLQKRPLFTIISLVVLIGTAPREKLIEGKGSFLFLHYTPLEDKPVEVYYYRPKGDIKTMPILFVLHGTNRNADNYRDNWIELSDKHQVLIIAPEFTRDYFPGSRGYNLGGMFDKDGNQVEEELWAYSLIEPIFDKILALTGSEQETYDMFGHSAGSQFTHRFFLFKRNIRVNRVIASNAGWYTMPDVDAEFPYGLKNTVLDMEILQERFAQKLVIQLGENDNDPAHRYLRTTEQAMKQGEHRFERGRHFFQTVQNLAEQQDISLRWSLRTVPGVGHNNAGMAVDAAEYLYGTGNDD